MYKPRPAVYITDTDHTVPMPVAKQEAIPNNVVKMENRNQGQVKELRFNIESDNNLIEYLNRQIKEKGYYNYRGHALVEIELERGIATIVGKDGSKKIIQLSLLLSDIRFDIKKEQNDLNLAGKPVGDKQLFELLDQDIANKRPFRGKYITRYDDKWVYFDDGSRQEFTQFVEDFTSDRTVDPELMQAGFLEQQEILRQNNIADMADAFRQALGIRPPRVKTYKENESRNISKLRTTIYNARDPELNWTVDELQDAYRTGTVSNPVVNVSGTLNNVFNPYKDPAEFTSEVQPLANITESKFRSKK